MKRLAALMLFLIATAPTLARADDLWLKQLHRTYTGFTFGDGTIRTLSYAQTFVNGKGETTDNVHTVRAGLAYRSDEHFPKPNTDDSTGFTGNIFWYSDENGFVAKLAGNEISTRYAKLLVETDAIAELPWEFMKTDTAAGSNVDVVRATLSTGLTIDLYVDHATGAYKRVVIDPAGPYQSMLDQIAYTEIRTGVRLMATWHLGDSRVTASDFTLNPTVADAELQPPPKTAQWTFGTQPIPFSGKNDRIIIHALVNGVQGTFLLDTGAAGVFFTGEFARRAHITATGHSGIATLYGDQKSDIGRVTTLQLGDSTLTNVLAYFGMGTFDTDGPDGMIGYGALAGAYVSIDFKHSTLTLSDSSQIDPATSGGVVVPAGFADGQPVISMLLSTSLDLDAIIDTGNPGGVLISSNVVGGYGLHFYSRDSEDPCGEIDALSVGTIVYNRPKACLTLGGSGRWVLLGMDFLKQFDRIDFDYPVGDVIFFPKKP